MSRPPTTELLKQSEVWYDADGDRIVLSTMDNEHLANLRGWLLRNAVKLQAAEVADLRRTQLYGTGLADAMQDFAASVVIGTHPLYWMEQRPLFLAIDRIINERRGYIYVRVIPQEAGLG
jgi:hypothetical protein